MSNQEPSKLHKQNVRQSISRILLKISGETLGKQGIDYEKTGLIAQQIKKCYEQSQLQIAVVVGGGNILRGENAQKYGMDRASADYMGMLATVINALALQEACEKLGILTRVQSAIAMEHVAEKYIRRKALRHLEKKRLVIFAAGTGNPYFTTDTTAALRAVEMNCDIILKATKVGGVYDKDPLESTSARCFKEISHSEALKRNLKIMDATAFTLCSENAMPIIVFDIFKQGNLHKVLEGQQIGTLISHDNALSYYE